MKPHFLFFIASLLICLNSWSQVRVLQVENRKSGEQIIIPPSTKVVLTTINNRYHGSLILLSDSLIQVDSNVFSLNDVNSLQVVKNNREKTRIGLELLILGSAGVVTGGVVAIAASISNFWGSITDNTIGSTAANPAYGIGIMTLGTAAAVSGIVVLAKRESYSKSKYQFEILSK